MKLLGISGLAAMASANMLAWNEKRCIFKANHQAVRGANCAFNLDVHHMSAIDFECYFRNEFYADPDHATCGDNPNTNWVIVDVRTAEEQDSDNFHWPTKNSFANRVVINDPTDNLASLSCQSNQICAENKIAPFFNIFSGQFNNQDGNMCGNQMQTNRARGNRNFHGYNYQHFYDGLAAGNNDYGLIMVCGANAASRCDDMAHRTWSYFLRRHNADINIRMTTDVTGIAGKMAAAALAADGEGSFCGPEVASWRSLEAGNN